MLPKTLCVRARGAALCCNYEAMEAGQKRFIGRKFIEVGAGQYGFAPTGENVVVPYRGEYMQAVQEGDLWAADAETAKVCGVEFDPNFGDKADKKGK